MSKIIIYTDGGSRGNPGPAAVGVVIKSEKGELIKNYSQYLGKATNNEAEYQAILFALKKIKLLFGKKKTKKMNLEFFLDSELVVSQLDGTFKLKDKRIQQLFIKVWNLKMDFGKIKFNLVVREKNKEADRLVNQELDSQVSKKSLPGI